MNKQTTKKDKSSFLRRMIGKRIWVESHGKEAKIVDALDEEHMVVLFYNDTEPRREKVSVFEVRSL
jgi:hypothetical protein